MPSRFTLVPSSTSCANRRECVRLIEVETLFQVLLYESLRAIPPDLREFFAKNFTETCRERTTHFCDGCSSFVLDESADLS